MNRFRIYLAPLFLAVFAPIISAQTPANISVISGNGQLICPSCPTLGNTVAKFDGMFVKVTDVSGNAVANATVAWAITASTGSFINGTTLDQTLTDSNGIAVEYFIPVAQSGTPFVQSAVTASISNGVSVVFYQTIGFDVISAVGGAPLNVFVSVEPSTVCPTCLDIGSTLAGAAGTTAQQQLEIRAFTSNGQPIPNVSLRLVNNQATPSVSCATSAGADPGAVLTDVTGIALCTPVLGPAAGAGSFYVLAGGVALVGNTPGAGSQGFFASGNFPLNITPGTPGGITLKSGNNQSAVPGQAVTSPLVAQVVDVAGNPLAGQQVVWTVTPTGAVTLTGTTTTSDSNGQVQTNVSLPLTTSGQVTVKVALQSNPNISTSFVITAVIQVSGLQFLASNSQTILENANTALTVQLTAANGQSAANIPITFSVSGPATLGGTTAVTNAQGQATVSVIAGSTTGTVTVNAVAGGQTAIFTLTVIPPGPTLTTNSFYNGADFQPGSISPCGIATIVAPGIASAIQGVVAYDGVGALPYTLGGDTVTFGGAQAPIFNVANMNGQQQITVQVPCSVTPGSVPVVVTVGGGSGSVTVNVQAASPGLFLTQYANNNSIPVLERPDGSFVSPTNPAVKGETLIAYVTGLGPTTPSVATNALPAPGSKATLQGTVIVGLNGQGIPSAGTALSSDLVGVQTVSFTLPSSTPSGTSGFSIGVLYPTGGSTIYYSYLGKFPVQ